MLFILFFLYIAAFPVKAIEERPCNEREFPCDNEGCIRKEQWCDGLSDCGDGSDEKYCDGEEECLEHHFRCNDGGCIPWNGHCDKFLSCKDGSDEMCDYLLENAARKAASYLMGERQPDFSWGQSTPRAIVALSFVENLLEISPIEKMLMRNQLNIQLAMSLMKNLTNGKMNPSHLALYINALYATCQDPRHFQGMDLVELLRSRADSAIRTTRFSLPLVLLSLCIAGEGTYDDFRVLSDIYSQNGNKTDSTAIALIAMSCIFKQKFRNFNFEGYRSHFVRVTHDLEAFDVYTKALVLQALNAIDHGGSASALIPHQTKNGSFGDLLATYYAIPALLNTSLMSLREKCGSSNTPEDASGEPSLLQVSPNSSKVTYSLWMGNGGDMNSHSMTVSFAGNKTLFDIMKIAEARDSVFRFGYDDTNEGKVVYSLSGVPNDAETGRSWILYLSRRNHAMISKTGLRRQNLGIDKIYPGNESHFIFSFESDTL